MVKRPAPEIPFAGVGVIVREAACCRRITATFVGVCQLLVIAEDGDS